MHIAAGIMIAIGWFPDEERFACGGLDGAVYIYALLIHGS
jgi:hypothetical protein